MMYLSNAKTEVVNGTFFLLLLASHPLQEKLSTHQYHGGLYEYIVDREEEEEIPFYTNCLVAILFFADATRFSYQQ